MGDEEYRFRSARTIEEIAVRFKSGIEQSRPKGLIMSRATRLLRWEFFTPAPSPTDPFAAFKQDEAPAFTVGARCSAFGMNAPGEVVLTIWDRGAAREATVSCEGLAPAAKAVVTETMGRLRS